MAVRHSTAALNAAGAATLSRSSGLIGMGRLLGCLHFLMPTAYSNVDFMGLKRQFIRTNK